MTDEDALKLLITWLRNPPAAGSGEYGYDLYIPRMMKLHVAKVTGRPDNEIGTQHMREISPSFYTAAWELCRRGILRPGVKVYGAQATEEGSAGSGYSVTPFGRTWLAEADRDDFIPTEPERFGALLGRYHNRFGPGFSARGQEAIRCYGAHAYLACCAMSGGAAESILLATAIAKRNGDENAVLALYKSGHGRSKVEGIVVNGVQAPLQRRIEAMTELISYWRNDAAHGKPSRLSDMEAYTTLTMLLRLAALIDDHWTELMQ